MLIHRLLRIGVGALLIASTTFVCAARAEQEKTAEEYVREAMQSINAKQFKEALTKLDEAIDHDDRLAAAYFHRGMLLLQVNDEKGALQNFDAAMKLMPDYSPIYLGKGVIAYRNGQLEEAAKLLTHAIKLDPTSGMAFYNRGVVFYHQRKLEESEKDLTRALELGAEVDPDLFEEVWTLNHLDQVITESDEKICQDPKDAEAYYNRGIAYFYKKDFFRSRNDLEKAKSLGIEVEAELLREVQTSLHA